VGTSDIDRNNARLSAHGIGGGTSHHLYSGWISVLIITSTQSFGIRERAAIGHLVDPFRSIDKLSDMNFPIVYFVRLPAWTWDLVIAV
jgi:hypothetical protein